MPLPRGRLLWSDEFDQPTIDLTKWAYDNSLPENSELQIYVGPDPRTAVIQDGALVITALRQADGSIVSARLSTLHRFNFTFGVVEARMRVPLVQGFWPAFWTLGTSLLSAGWPGCGEIDIMEVFGSRRGSAACSTVHNLLHSWGTRDPLDGGCFHLEAVPDWHVWKLVWTPQRVAFYVDSEDENAPMWSFERTPEMTDEAFPYVAPQYIITNLAVGGNGPSEAVDEAALIAPGTHLAIDYVRVYELDKRGFESAATFGAPAAPGDLTLAAAHMAAALLALAVALAVWLRGGCKRRWSYLKSELAEPLVENTCGERGS